MGQRRRGLCRESQHRGKKENSGQGLQRRPPWVRGLLDEPGAWSTKFRPTTIRRVHQAQVVVTYVTDPSTSATGTVSIPLYGEGVVTGARVLVTLNGVPVSEVEKLHLQLADPSRNGGNEVTHDLPLATVVGPVPELTFQYHREWGGASNPAGFAPDDYKITVTIRVGDKRQTQTVFFSVKPCGFESNVIVSFF